MRAGVQLGHYHIHSWEQLLLCPSGTLRERVASERSRQNWGDTGYLHAAVFSGYLGNGILTLCQDAVSLNSVCCLAAATWACCWARLEAIKGILIAPHRGFKVSGSSVVCGNKINSCLFFFQG